MRKRMCIYTAGSRFSTAETGTTLYINYNFLKNLAKRTDTDKISVIPSKLYDVIRSF